LARGSLLYNRTTDFLVLKKGLYGHKMVEIAENIEHMEMGNTELTLSLLNVLQDHFELELDKAMHPENYYEEPDEDEE
jgi:hypothetical protein